MVKLAIINQAQAQIMKSQHNFTPIAYIKTPYPEKFSIPRQSRLTPSIFATVELAGDYAHSEAIKGIEQFSHLWLVFEFHQHSSWQEKVRPPRLGGNESVGVFASRSPFRPNQLGLSVVELISVETTPNVRLTVRGADIVDGTPIVDIKPYIPYVDAVADAKGGFADSEPDLLQVEFSEAATQYLEASGAQSNGLRAAIIDVLQQDPRPAYHKVKSTKRVYGTALFNYNIRWYVEENTVFVKEIAQNTR